MKKNSRRLQLNYETLRALDPQQMNSAKAGEAKVSTVCEQPTEVCMPLSSHDVSCPMYF